MNCDEAVINIIVIEYLPDIICLADPFTHCQKSLFNTPLNIYYCSDQCANNFILLDELDQCLWDVSVKIINNILNKREHMLTNIYQQIYPFLFSKCECGTSELCCIIGNPVLQQGKICNRCIDLHDDGTVDNHRWCKCTGLL